MHKNSTYDNSSLFIKILAWLTLIALGFVLFHLAMILAKKEPQYWVNELYMTLQSGIPLFLFLTGTFVRSRKFRIPAILLLSVFFAASIINSLDSYGIFEDMGIEISFAWLKWMLCIPLAGLLIIYPIHFFMKREKKLLDILKLVWFLCIGYAFLSVRFPIGWHAFYFFLASLYLTPILMSWGMFRFFYPKQQH